MDLLELYTISSHAFKTKIVRQKKRKGKNVPWKVSLQKEELCDVGYLLMQHAINSVRKTLECKIIRYIFNLVWYQ